MKRSARYFALVALVVPAFLVGVESASAVPSACRIWFTPTDANPNYTGVAGICTSGTGQYRVSAHCAVPLLPDYDKYSAWVNIGQTASVKCNFNNLATAGKLYKR